MRVRVDVKSVTVWRKWFSPVAADLWMAAWGPKFGARAITTAEKRRPRVRIDIYPRSSAEGAGLKARLGGRLVVLTPKVWWRPQEPRAMPLRIGRRLLIVATEVQAAKWAKRLPGRGVVLIPAGLAFGTGQHATTRMCLEALSQAWPFDTMMDAGCGSGILAIAAAMVGASRVEAFDNDPAAVRTARANARRNNVRFQVRRMGVEALRGRRKFDVLAANILADTLADHAPRLERMVRRGGRIILSGIRSGEARRVVAAFRGCRLAAKRGSEGWACLVLRRR